ncbi:MAG: hypothetical protein ACOX4B_03430 [Bacillota bacterium]|jgi:hypothetical protein|nr:hypothetical protein [Candidatus Fermentithermobacillaceae bacterium]
MGRHLHRGVRALAVPLIALLVGWTVLFLVNAYRYRDEFVFVTIEESSSQALAALPLGWERLTGIFVDCENRCLELKEKPRLWGVSLGAYYSASSQGIEFEESMDFSRTGKAAIPLRRPVSLAGRDLSGNVIELIDNSARVVRGNLVIEGTGRSGIVRFRYGGERFSLAPGESWAEILALVDGTPVRVDEGSWENAVQEYLASGVPVTRVAVSNRGFWPKEGVCAGEDQGGEVW